jgi:hypothetical protein
MQVWNIKFYDLNSCIVPLRGPVVQVLSKYGMLVENADEIIIYCMCIS